MNVRIKRGKLAHRKGLRAELLSVLFLRLKFYRILAYRFKTPVGEIDIVAQRGNTMIFVEVKARQDLDLAAAALTPRTLGRLERAMGYFLARHQYSKVPNLRFDVMLITPKKIWPRHIRGEAGILSQANRSGVLIEGFNEV